MSVWNSHREELLKPQRMTASITDAGRLRLQQLRKLGVLILFMLAPLAPEPAGAAAAVPPTLGTFAAEAHVSRPHLAAFVAGETVVRGPHGGAAVRRGVVVTRPARPPRPGVHRPPHVRPHYPRPPIVRPPMPPAAWVRPPSYWWHPGLAVASGAAIGFVTATAAARWAGPPPSPGYCWYYTDADRTKGFWDICPPR